MNANFTLKIAQNDVSQVRQESLKKPSSYDLISLNRQYECADHPSLFEEGKVPSPSYTYMHVYVDVYEHRSDVYEHWCSSAYTIDLISPNRQHECADHPSLFEEGKVPPPSRSIMYMYTHMYVDVYFAPMRRIRALKLIHIYDRHDIA